MEDNGGSSLFRQQHPREDISISDNADESYSPTIEDCESVEDIGGSSLFRQQHPNGEYIYILQDILTFKLNFRLENG